MKAAKKLTKKTYVIENKVNGKIIRYVTKDTDTCKIACDVSDILDCNPCQLKLIEVIEEDKIKVNYIKDYQVGMSDCLVGDVELIVEIFDFDGDFIPAVYKD